MTQIQEIYNRYCEIREVCIEISKKIRNREYGEVMEGLSKLTPIASLEYLIGQDGFKYENTSLWSKLSELIGYLNNRINILPNILQNAEELKKKGEDAYIYEDWKLIDETIEKIDKEFEEYNLHKSNDPPIYA